jgi:4-hydroxy-2-oxoheptanedioate aldolase
MKGRSAVEFKTAMQRGEVLFGTWLTSSDPMVTEVIASAGFDFCILDAEHGPVTASSALMTQIVADRVSVPLLVRVPAADPVHIMSALDLGATGIVVPRVASADEAAHAVRLAHYPPNGCRGYGPRRASNYLRNVDAYLDEAAEATTVIIQIENQGALSDLDGILALPHVDGILIGRNDLAVELGISRDPADSELQSITTGIIERAHSAGKAVGLACSALPASVQAARDLGATFVAAGIDLEFLARSVDSFISNVQSQNPSAKQT